MGWVLLSGGIFFWTACGSEPAPTNPDPPDNGENPAPQTEREGHISVENRTEFPLEIVYLDRREADTWPIVRLRLEPMQQQNVSETIWPAGFKIELDAVLLLPAEVGFRVRRKATVVVDGDINLVFQLEGEDPFSAHFVGF